MRRSTYKALCGAVIIGTMMLYAVPVSAASATETVTETREQTSSDDNVTASDLFQKISTPRKHCDKNAKAEKTKYAKETMRVYADESRTMSFATLLKGQTVDVLSESSACTSIRIGPYVGYVRPDSLSDQKTKDDADTAGNTNSDQSPTTASAGSTLNVDDLVPVKTKGGYTVYISKEDAAAFASELASSENAESSSISGTDGITETYQSSAGRTSTGTADTSGQTEVYTAEDHGISCTAGTKETYYAP